MLCPHCGGELEAISCPDCGADNLPEAVFCCQCASRLPADDPLDLANRVLCPDGACIGVLNAQGECSACGYAYKEVLAAESEDG
jgi:hypothetical protein